MIKITNLKIPLDYDLKTLEKIAAEKLCIPIDRIQKISIAKKAVNNDDKQNIYFDLTLLVSITGSENEIVWGKKSKGISIEETPLYKFPVKKLEQRPVVIGFGPAGLFSALILAKSGARPIVLERGLDVDRRTEKVHEFWNTGILDTQTNVQFGEGGAGAFSDGKLKIGLKDARKTMILEELIASGAPPEIMYLSKPHIGTDKLKIVVKKIRKNIIDLGGEVHFGAEATEIIIKNNIVKGVRYTQNCIENEIETDNVILAIGHSARDTFEKLFNCGIKMEQKPLAIGVRIEHPQEYINKIQYGNFADHPSLGATDYHMVVHLKNSRGVYTFCMCPGGSVVAATSEENHLTTNGMSEYARNGRNANTALLITINKDDYLSNHPLAGMEFQRRIEKAAFIAGGGGYKAPIQRLEDFLLKRNTTSFGDVSSTYMPGTAFAEVDSYLPDYITDSLRQGVLEMGDWMPGFNYPEAILTGAETRSSSPVRILRNENFHTVGVKGLFPCGEGAGYAGGIISAAVDGVICAESILLK
ncbi:MAG: hypothetical protein A2Y15_05590 [Clostridiales bacterium GWF2_36_10]|nr:MAG: hypothetical protein A2Y15_05590 [Clostridiales bacterium GWF2_36_10]HAN21984.1 hypothetical protein [Clostridiales bacterium]